MLACNPSCQVALSTMVYGILRVFLFPTELKLSNIPQVMTSSILLETRQHERWFYSASVSEELLPDLPKG